MKRGMLFTGGFALLVATGLGLWWWRFRASLVRTRRLLTYLREPQTHADWRIPARARCRDAPFLTPTEGYIGYLWGDAFRPGHRHTGIDIFGGGPNGQTPVYAAYPGELYRGADWKASLIIRHRDPLHPGRIIWTYYTHLADEQGRSLIDAAFPPGTEGVPVEAGTFLGYQGNFSGTPGRPVGVHLHFSIVRSDARGHYLDERRLENTLDPSPYLGFPLRYDQVPGDQVPTCPTAWELSEPGGHSLLRGLLGERLP
ncbi:MAG: M23 family metallopeptidase [Chloroflexi bacterium]|nr:M23 family metallopeptidase [Chloroflexota bacterium]